MKFRWCGYGQYKPYTIYLQLQFFFQVRGFFAPPLANLHIKFYYVNYASPIHKITHPVSGRFSIFGFTLESDSDSQNDMWIVII